MPEVDLDALGLLAAQRLTSVHFGPIDVGSALKEGNLNRAVNTMSDANLVLDLGLATIPPDYFGVLTVAIDQDGQRFPRFTGTVASAQLSPQGMTISGLGVLSLLDRPIEKFATRGLPRPEFIYVLARSSGTTRGAAID
jgi:hypothetical protein